jgi:hypothetical protein
MLSDDDEEDAGVLYVCDTETQFGGSVSRKKPTKASIYDSSVVTLFAKKDACKVSIAGRPRGNVGSLRFRGIQVIVAQALSVRC